VGWSAARLLAVAVVIAAGSGLARATDAQALPTAGPPPIEQFDPERTGTIEQQAWEAYYLRDWPRLGALLWELLGSSYRLAPAEAAQATMLATQAQRVWAERGAADGEAERLLRAFYALVREPAGGRYDPARAAALEIGWWAVHRQRVDATETAAVEDALAALWAEVYQLPLAAVRPAARHRARAVALSDAWVRAGRERDSPLLEEVRAELIRGYTALRAALDARRAAEETSPAGE
jgi:hypothetical protein